MAMLIYVLGLLTSFIGPLILWLMKRQESRFIDHHGKEYMNMTITACIAALPCGIPLIVLGPVYFVCTIIALIKAKNGEWYTFPMIFRFIK
jgi:uncharacterized Tic20 family protein